MYIVPKTIVSILSLLLLAGCITPHRATTPVQPASPTVGAARTDLTQLSVPSTCPNVTPVCAGGLISQHATPDDINAYMAKYNLAIPLTCRFQEPPRCAGGVHPRCAECTP